MSIEPSHGITPHMIAGARPIGAADARVVRTAAGVKDASTTPGNGVAGGVNLTASGMLDPGPAPINAERVAVIRKAIESGSYPVLPTKIADAMIAAGLLLRVKA